MFDVRRSSVRVPGSGFKGSGLKGSDYLFLVTGFKVFPWFGLSFKLLRLDIRYSAVLRFALDLALVCFVCPQSSVICRLTSVLCHLIIGFWVQRFTCSTLDVRCSMFDVRLLGFWAIIHPNPLETPAAQPHQRYPGRFGSYPEPPENCHTCI